MSERREQQIFIHAPALRKAHRRAGDQLLTLLMWGIYAYLWLPFISLVAWFFGIDLFYQEMVLNGGFDAFVDLSAWYLLVIVLILLLVIAWSASNYLRFRGASRRKAQSQVSDPDIADWFAVDLDFLESARTNRTMTLTFSEDDQALAGSGPRETTPP